MISAPAAPGRPGEPVEPGAMLAFLRDLGSWRDGRRHELDELDDAALASPDRAALTGDMTLAMTLWQAVATRADELEDVWDSGRVGPTELQRLSAMVWGRLGDGGALAVSLPEACRLSDAVVAQLRRRLSLDPVDHGLGTRLRSVRAALERIRDLVADVPPAGRADAVGRLDALDRRATDLVDRARRGADVGGMVGPLETDVAIAERDLIVAAATRRDAERDRARAEELRSRLAARGEAVAAVVDECVASVRPAPVLAVPRVEALGPVPGDPAAVEAYLDRLGDVARAMDVVERAYREPVAELSELRALLDGYRAKAAATGLDARPEVVGLAALAADVVDQRPADLDRSRAAVAAYRTLLAPPPDATRGGL
ncbi:hypothetical protein OEB99_01875 [Actinotalea sp. M2MS4P-6]|uniref:hypothetical protein n=1 Tax=Actinotalea sp. M2MS4P-6 TaxID=2983762 RepID=UPI0021E4CAF7|nr:hypothetical protein [Actinotalea sp. M2MS4P-6]MCV2393045.1 hypothetical protein [Actinotalea sp. M2MS4P-6]